MLCFALQVADSNDVGEFPSLTTLQGMPAIAYADATAMVPKFVLATNASGSTWATPVTVAPTTGSPVTGVSLTSCGVTNGAPCVAFTTGSLVKFAMGPAVGSGDGQWATAVTVDTVASPMDIQVRMAALLCKDEQSLLGGDRPTNWVHFPARYAPHTFGSRP